MRSFGFVLFVMTLWNSALISQGLLLFVEDKERLDMEDVSGSICKAFTDIDGDYRDDIIRLDRNRQLLLELSSNNGMKYSYFPVGKPDAMPYTISVGDLDNNGTNDIITSGYYDGFSTWSVKNNLLEFDLKSYPDNDYFAQASNIVDINNDGWLDIFICNDDGLSKIYLNDGLGGFVESPELIDMRTEIPSDNSGNYGSEWTDADGDGDLDLHIAKCRLGVDSNTDPRRINTLYINDNGQYREEAESFGINVGAQTWTGNFGDIDNDGDMDLFLANHDAPCMLFENIDNAGYKEIDIQETGEPIITEAYQSAMHDLNNDGLLDIILGGFNDMILVNQGDNTFFKLENPFGFNDIISFALGDANRDGFTDVLASYNLFGNAGTTKDKLWLNLTNENHFLNVNLQGTQSNRNGIGARLELYGSWGKQSRIIQSGSGYTVTHSLSAHFGLGESRSIDSLVVNWPSGQKDVYSDLKHDRFYLAIENSCCEILPNAIPEAEQLDCDQKEIIVESENAIEIEWSNSVIGTETIIDHLQILTGEYAVTDQCRLPTQSIYIDTLPLPKAIELDIEDSLLLCYPSDIKLSSRENIPTQWSTNDLSTGISIEESGTYFSINSNKCDTVYSDVVNVDFINPDEYTGNRDTLILDPQVVKLYSIEEDVIWYTDISRMDTLYKGNAILSDTIFSDTSFYFDYRLEQIAPSYIVGPSAVKEERLSSEANFVINLGILFRVEKPILLNSIQTYTNQEGPRIFQIIDQSTNAQVYNDTLFLESGLNRIDYTILLEQGDYLMQTNEFFNLQQYQNPSPLLATYEGTINYPYKVDDVLEIESSTIGKVVYPYFFDWRFEPIVEECRSGLNTVSVSVLSSSTIDDVPAKNLIYPNPFENRLNLDQKLIGYNLEIYKSDGQKLFERKDMNQDYLDLGFLPTGFYILKCHKAGKIYNFKLVKQ